MHGNYTWTQVGTILNFEYRYPKNKLFVGWHNSGVLIFGANSPIPANLLSWNTLVEIKGSNIPGLRQVLDQGLMLGSRQLGDFLENNLDGYTNPRPVFEITYLSKNLRISREQDGKVFVYGKLSDELEPSDYSKVEADLGALTLLEGFNDAITKFYI